VLGKDKMDIARPLGVCVPDVVEIPFLDTVSRTFNATFRASSRLVVAILPNNLWFGKIIDRLGHFSGVLDIFTNWAHVNPPSEVFSKG